VEKKERRSRKGKENYGHLLLLSLPFVHSSPQFPSSYQLLVLREKEEEEGRRKEEEGKKKKEKKI